MKRSHLQFSNKVLLSDNIGIKHSQAELLPAQLDGKEQLAFLILWREQTPPLLGSGAHRGCLLHGAAHNKLFIIPLAYWRGRNQKLTENAVSGVLWSPSLTCHHLSQLDVRVSLQRFRCMSWRATTLRHGEVTHFKVNTRPMSAASQQAFPLKFHWNSFFFCPDVYLQWSRHFLIRISPQARQVGARFSAALLRFSCSNSSVPLCSSVFSTPSTPYWSTRSTGCQSSIQSLGTFCIFWPTKESSGSSTSS